MDYADEEDDRSATVDDSPEDFPDKTSEASEARVEVETNHSDIMMTEIDPANNHTSQEVLILDDDSGQTMFFDNSDTPQRIDYCLTYDTEEDDPVKKDLRKNFEENLSAVGVLLEHELSSDRKVGCVKIHSPWDALTKGAKLIQMRKKIKINKEVETTFANVACLKMFDPVQTIVPDEEDFFTAPFDPDRLENFAVDDRETFFTNAERNLLTKLFLDNTEFTVKTDDGAHVIHKGVDSLVHQKVYTAAFPLHEGRIKPLLHEPGFFEGPDKDRLRLYHGWAKPSNALRFQPLDYVRKYFGEKIGLYFAWLGTYTLMLIPATLFGLGVFLYGLITLAGDAPSSDVCNKTGPGGYLICPLCDNLCDYQELSGSCIYARLTYVFDNYATVAMAIFMAAWALIFLEMWKREQAALQFMWDISDYEADETYRPGYEKNLTKFKINPITEKPEPYLPWYEKFLRLFTSLSMIFFLIVLVCCAIFAVLVYRLAIAAALFAAEKKNIQDNAKLITTVTASIINLILISILSVVYQRLAIFATKLEKHKTFSDHEDSYTFKIVVFQFVNYYGSILYIAFFKGSFIDPPGKSRMYVFGKYRQDQCDPTGCFIELTIQLAIIMIGKQALNGIVEIIIPAIMNCFRQMNDNMAKRKRWEDDLDLQAHPQFPFFDDYLEMVIQFGFVTLFVAAFPLAPLFAFLNNVIEIRLDAYKAIKLFRRPPAIKAQDIGAWYPILRGFAYIAVITNAFIIAWTSEFIPKMVYIWNDRNDRQLDGYMDASLSVTKTSLLNSTQRPDALIYHPEFANVTECRFRGHYQLNAEDEYVRTSDYWQIFFARMAFVIVFEHLCFFMINMISVLIPDVSAKTKRMRRYERLILRRMAFEDTFTDVRDKRKTMYLEAARFHFDKIEL